MLFRRWPEQSANWLILLSMWQTPWPSERRTSLSEHFCFSLWTVSNNLSVDVRKSLSCSLARKFWIMGTGPLTCKTYCSCNLGSSFWSTRCRGFYSRGCSRTSEYRLFRCLSVVVYNWITHQWGSLYWSSFSIISFCYIFNSGLVTPTTQMETKRFVVQKCRISSQSSFVRTFRSKFLGLDRTFSSCRYSCI